MIAGSPNPTMNRVGGARWSWHRLTHEDVGKEPTVEGERR